MKVIDLIFFLCSGFYRTR